MDEVVFPGREILGKSIRCVKIVSLPHIIYIREVLPDLMLGVVCFATAGRAGRAMT